MKKNLFLLLSMAIIALGLMTTISCKKDENKPKPVPDFTTVINDKIVTFTNTSTDATSYSWDFGDESAVSTEVNPVHTYAAYGDFDVRLTAKGDGGQEIKKETISVVKVWPAITIDGSFADWANIPVFYGGYGEASGTLTEAKVTSEASGSKIYIYLKGTINADYPVVQVMINADGDSLTGWKTPLEYAINGAEYQFEYFAVDLWGGSYRWNSDPGIQDWPWDIDNTTDPDLGDIKESSGVKGGTEIEFIIETSLMKNPVIADKIGIFFWAQPEDWSTTAGFLPPIFAEPREKVKTFSFQ